ncbi:MAG: DUF1275 domain-containing protein [Oscillospiraceae bacterium]|nr:DUF1275 domain-containing protein [Oscillospiraceae bacterium]
MKDQTQNPFPRAEQHHTFWALILLGGFFGVYTFSVRGGVFCNAQTANIALFVMHLGLGDWARALYLLIPMSAYFSGTVLSEYLNRKLSHNRYLHWDVALMVFDIAVVIFLGLLPKSAPDQICQVMLNFICSMQFNTFRMNEGTPMATTFVTNHVRETGSHLVRSVMDKDARSAVLWKLHASMIGFFMLGGLISAFMCRFFDVRAIFGALPILLYVLIRLMKKAPSQNF